MTDTELITILKDRGIYVTNTRIAVFRIMHEHKGTINASQIHKLAPARLDRVSVYRALQAFHKKGLIAEIPGTKGWPKYLVTNTGNNKTNKASRVQVYFVCRKCGTVEAGKTFHSIDEFLPDKREVSNCELILEGICSSCDKK